MAFPSARWRWEFLGTASSNESDANPPVGDNQRYISLETTHDICCLAAQYINKVMKIPTCKT